MCRLAFSAIAALVLLVGDSPASRRAPERPDLALLAAALAGRDSYSPAISPDGRTIYVTVREDRSNEWQWISATEWRAGSWSAPAPLPFRRREVSDRDPAITPDGRHLVFSSDRPGGAGSTFTLWRAERSAAGWSEPEPIPGLEAVRDAKGPAVAADGALYFSTPATVGDRADLWVARPRGDGYGEPVRLAELSSRALDLDPWVSPAGTVLVFASDRDSSAGDCDLYVATRSVSGWSAARRLPHSEAGVWDEGPAVFPEGDRLLWSQAWGELRVAPWASPPSPSVQAGSSIRP